MSKEYTVTEDGKLVEDRDTDQQFSEMNFEDDGE